MDELNRIRAEYARREQDARFHDRYSRFNQADIFLLQERERELLRLLDRFGSKNIYDLQVLDIGCGSGHQLARFVSYGVNPQNLFGIDLLLERLLAAKSRFANLHFVGGHAAELPYPDNVFDLLLQFTVFTSILQEEMRRSIAKEMVRVLKPGGLILWYDYRLNPVNPQTRGIERKEIANLFPNCDYFFRRITLAPPIARRVAPRSWLACALLSQLSFLKTHYLAVIRTRQHETRV